MSTSRCQRLIPEKFQATFLLVLLLSGILLNLLLIMNPGYYSHEELTFLWESKNLSLSGLHWKPAVHNVEYRPLARNLEMIVIALIGGYPQIVHLFNVLIHLVIAFIVFSLAGRLAPELGKKFQAVVFLLFVVSPMATFGVGWSAALYDPIYVFFSLIVLWICISRNEVHFEGAMRGLLLFGAIFILSALALLSKETGVMLVAYVFLLLLFRGIDRKGMVALFAVGTATSIYAFVRFKSIFHIATESAVGYKVNLGHNVAHNFVQYFLYPFTSHVSEIHTIFILAPKWELFFAAAIHIFIIIMLCRRRFIYGVWYIAAFSVTLLPILIINMTASHYLYAAAIPLSFSLAYLVCTSRNRAVSAVLLGSIFLLFLHGLANQYFFYWTGIHQQKILTSLSTLVRSMDHNNSHKLEGRIVIVAESNSPGWILSRVLTAVNLQQEIDGIRIEQIEMISLGDYQNLNLTAHGKALYMFYKADGSLLLKSSRLLI